MHELSIAYSVVEIATESAKAAGAVRVKEVHVRLGALSGVVRGALEFCFEVACAGTLLEGSVLVVKELPARIWCGVCEREVELPSTQYFCCPVCNTPSGDLRQGRELDVESIEVDLPGDDDGNASVGDTQRDSQ